MKPINPSSSPSFDLLNQLVNIASKHELFNEWKTWAKECKPGKNEQRDIALNRLEHCIENENSCLELSDLNLTDLPKIWPNFITSLIVINNQLTLLPETLPDSIQDLDISNNQLSTLPNHLPNSLVNLYISNNRWEKFFASFPSSLKKIQVNENFHLLIGDHLHGDERVRVIKKLVEHHTSAGFFENLGLWDPCIALNQVDAWENIKHEKNAVEFGLFLCKLDFETLSNDLDHTTLKIRFLLKTIARPQYDAKRALVFTKAKEIYEANTSTEQGLSELYQVLFSPFSAISN